MPRCACCGNVGADLKRCAACKSSHYCDVACQKRHRKAHRADCELRERELTEAAAARSAADAVVEGMLGPRPPVPAARNVDNGGPKIPESIRNLRKRYPHSGDFMSALNAHRFIKEKAREARESGLTVDEGKLQHVIDLAIDVAQKCYWREEGHLTMDTLEEFWRREGRQHLFSDK